MKYLYGALIMWVAISWIFFILGETGCIEVFSEDKALWFLFAPMWILVVFVLPISQIREKRYVLSKMQFEAIKKCNFLYKQIGKKWWLCRYYGNKEERPILYHLLVFVRIEIK